jgi:hypothetical protein
MRREGGPEAAPLIAPSMMEHASAALADAHSRLVRIEEALDLGDFEFVAFALPDLAADLWSARERLEGQR